MQDPELEREFERALYQLRVRAMQLDLARRMSDPRRRLRRLHQVLSLQLELTEAALALVEQLRQP